MSSKVVARRSNIHGTGVFARQDIERGERIIEYKGQRRSHEDVDADDAGDAESGHTFLFTLNDAWVIDGTRNGNVAKWINFSCNPNAEAVLEESDSKDRRRDKVFIEAKRAIKAGDELTYDYNITLDIPHTARLKKIWECRCGSKNCKGTMLKSKAPSRKAAAKKAVAKKAAAKKAVAKKAVAKKAVAKKASGQKASAKKVAAKKTTARKDAVTRAVGRKAGKKTPARKSPTTSAATGAGSTAATRKAATRKALKTPRAEKASSRTAAGRKSASRTP